jgi:hypothetical protein
MTAAPRYTLRLSSSRPAGAVCTNQQQPKHHTRMM